MAFLPFASPARILAVLFATVLLVVACGADDPTEPPPSDQPPLDQPASDEIDEATVQAALADEVEQRDGAPEAGADSGSEIPSVYGNSDSQAAAESEVPEEAEENQGKTGPQARPVIDPDDAEAERPPAPPPAPTEISETELILVPSDQAAHDEWGWSADTDGVRLISGAPFHDDQGDQSGVAVIFVRDEDGSWTEEAELLPDDGEANAWFGRWTAIDGDVAVVGAPLTDIVGDDDDAGAAYVFERRDAAWVQTQRLVADVPKGGHQFGWNVAVERDTIVVSSSNDSDGGGQRVYVFWRAGAEWLLEAQLEPSERDLDYFYGQDIAISGDTIVVGAKGRDSLRGPNTGAVFVFERSPEGWQQSTMLEADDSFVLDLFGRAIAVAGDTIVVGAYLEDAAGPDAGSVYVFERDSAVEGGWRQDAKLVGSSTSESDWFGYEVDTDGQTIVVGAPHSDRVDPEIVHAGLATVFTRTDDGWQQIAELAASDAGTAGDSADYGWAVAVQDGIVMVGAWLADTDIGPDAGRAYVYSLTD